MSVVLITGAAKRLGRAIALKLAAEGFDIAIHYRSSKAEAEALALEVKSLGRRAALVEGELSAEAEVAALVPRAARRPNDLTSSASASASALLDR